MATEYHVRLIISYNIGSLSRIGEVRQNIINIQSQFLGKKLDSKHGAAQVVLEEAPESAQEAYRPRRNLPLPAKIRPENRLEIEGDSRYIGLP